MNSHRLRTPHGRRLLAVLAPLAASLAVLAPSASAADPTAELRVVGNDGAIDSGTWYVLPKGQISAPLAANDGNCAPRSTPKRESYPQRSALGVALNGAALNPDLRGTRIQAFDFGPLLCRYAGIVGEAFDPETNTFSGWNYYVDYAGGSSSADLAEITNGDRVLWAFADQDTGSPLRLSGVPVSDEDGEFTVEVEAFGFDGQPAAAPGATIVGATSQTDNGDGSYDVVVPDGTTELLATRGNDIQSNSFEACSGDDCPETFGRTIVGTSKADDIATTPGDDIVRSGGGNDRVSALRGGSDRVNCGPGAKDVAIVPRGDAVRTSNCEKVRRSRG